METNGSPDGSNSSSSSSGGSSATSTSESSTESPNSSHDSSSDEELPAHVISAQRRESRKLREGDPGFVKPQKRPKPITLAIRQLNSILCQCGLITITRSP